MLNIIAILSIYYLVKNEFRAENTPSFIAFIDHPIDKKNESLNSVINKVAPFSKDPNRWSRMDWEYFGLSNNQINVVFKYKEKIAGFNTLNELLSCYVFNGTVKEKLKEMVVFSTEGNKKIKKENLIEYIFILESSAPNYSVNTELDSVYYRMMNGNYYYYLKMNKINRVSYLNSIFYDSSANIKLRSLNSSSLKLLRNRISIKKNVESIEVKMNNADSVDWLKLKGIGPIRADRIMKYRKSLGGFCKIDQISEVYGITDSLFTLIKSKLRIVDTCIHLIDLNKVTADSLVKHPYFNWNLSNAIVNYRFQHGDYLIKNKIKQIHLVNDEIYRKIAPYITVE